MRRIPATARGALLAASVLGWITVALAPAATRAAALEVATPYRLSPHVAPGQDFMGIRLLGSVQLAPDAIDGQVLGGLSGLAWDEDEARLYALSDRGALFHLRPHFEHGYLHRVELVAAFPLRDRHQRPLAGKRADAEAMVIRHGNNGIAGDSQLAVSFERYPRIELFDAEGRFLERLPLPAELGDVSRYASPNKALEALTWLPPVGFLTAPERPLVGAERGMVGLFTLNGPSWRYPLLDTPEASLVDMQALPDASLMTLERGHGLMFLPMVISLRHTRIDTAAAGERLAVTTLAVLDSSRGWSVDNFEGLSRHRGLKFFMVSDDNFNPLQKTLLVYFAVVNTDDPGDISNIPEYELHQQKRD